ncbi:MAG: hypothetical protein KJ072_23180 [Verrucomicrobia bacterium]|nr:hypothetical protein [Verrucomicrobiota bacterium]
MNDINPVTRHCGQCGHPFLAVPFVYGGRILAFPRYCESCIAGNERAEALERERKEAQRVALAWERICPPLYRDTDPSRLDCSLAARETILSWQFGPKGLLAHGPARLGKTRLVYLLLSRLHHLERRKIIALTANAFSHQVSVLFGAGGGRGEAFIDSLTDVPILFIDDIGKGRLTDRVESEFFHVIETRTAHLRPTLLTTNLNGQALRLMWSADRAEPLLGRFQEFFQTVAVVGQTTEDAI